MKSVKIKVKSAVQWCVGWRCLTFCQMEVTAHFMQKLFSVETHLMMGVGTIMMVLAMVIWICIETLKKKKKDIKVPKRLG